jgi:hypothetical protein
MDVGASDVGVAVNGVELLVSANYVLRNSVGRSATARRADFSLLSDPPIRQ